MQEVKDVLLIVVALALAPITAIYMWNTWRMWRGK